MMRTILTFALVLSLWVNIPQAEATADSNPDAEGVKISQMLVQPGRDGPPKKPSPVGMSCCNNTACHADNTVCNHGVCSCDYKHFLYEQHCLDCPEGKIGDHCSCPCPCMKGYECKNGHCECPYGYVGDKCDEYCPCPWDKYACRDGYCAGILDAPCFDNFTCIVVDSGCIRGRCDCLPGCYPLDGECPRCPPGEAGDLCNGYCPCNDGLDCVDGWCACVQNRDYGDMCYRDCQCLNFYTCMNYSCDCPHKPGQYGDPCDDDCPCAGGLECVNGVCDCDDSPLPTFGETCDVNCRCDDFYECISGRCDCPANGFGVDCNDNCTCAEGLFCEDGTCVCDHADEQFEGDVCHLGGNCPCDDILSCNNGVCECPSANGHGDACNSYNCTCAEGLVCDDGTCACDGNDGDGDHCDTDCTCSSPYICSNNLCGCADGDTGDDCEDGVCNCLDGYTCIPSTGCECTADPRSFANAPCNDNGCSCDDPYLCTGNTCQCSDGQLNQKCGTGCDCQESYYECTGGLCSCSAGALNDICGGSCGCSSAPAVNCVNGVCHDCSTKTTPTVKYQLFTLNYGWYDALDFCHDNGGDLAKITSAAELGEVVATFSETANCEEYRTTIAWIGLCQVTQTQYVWTQGGYLKIDLGTSNDENSNYENFLSSKSSAYDKTGGRDGDDCIGITGDTGNPWLDDDCDELKSFVCQFPVEEA